MLERIHWGQGGHLRYHKKPPEIVDIVTSPNLQEVLKFQVPNYVMGVLGPRAREVKR